MNSEKVISNIKKAIKEHLDNNYAYDMLVNFELDVIDWNSLFEYIDKLQKENAELKKQLENCYCNRTDCSGRIKDSKVYDSLVQKVETQQKEFIKFLEDNYKETQDIWYIKILQKYKSIIGDDKE